VIDAMRILHVLDHSLPLHSGYAFRTAAILREQCLQGFETLQLTTPRQNDGRVTEEDADGLHFLRTPLTPRKVDALSVVRYVREMAATERRIAAVVGRSLYASQPPPAASTTIIPRRERSTEVRFSFQITPSFLPASA